MPRRRPPGHEPDPFDALGLGHDADEAAIVEARRRLAKQAHPDAGGSVEAMQRVNLAAQTALEWARTGRSPSTAGSSSSRPAPRRRQAPDPAPPGTRRDHPSFTVEVLPVEAFEGLLVVASWLGTVIHDDPPYLLEVALIDPVRGWCRLEIVPDAGASTVSIAVAAEPGHPPPVVEAVRDLWIDGLNRLDWSDLDAGRLGGPPP